MKERDFFSDEEPVRAERSHGIDARSRDGRALSVERSSLWAAYGDALGWISELTDHAGLMRRTGGAALCRPVVWKRRIGGRSGVTVRLPAGCYSDDSQLRLATSRAIRSDGFDVEAFAKVELPVWLSYGLGAGRSTSAAAEHLARTKAVWWSNKFRGWTQSGGNGAAMRIQPHVWASRSPADAETFLPAVVRNSVCTHSHPNGLLGAVLHALCLAHTMRCGGPPSPSELPRILGVLEHLPDIVAGDAELGYWRVAFEKDAVDFATEWAKAIDALGEAAKLAQTYSAPGEEGYASIVNALKLCDPSRRGSGVLTALAAVTLAWCEPHPEKALRIATNALGTDTDTIATMAGAMLGVAAETEPPGDLLDADVFRYEARRLAQVAAGAVAPGHAYPDLLHWDAPRTRADALAQTEDGDLVVLGLGRARMLDGEVAGARGGFRWQWVKLEFGQTLLIKSRERLPQVPTKPTSRVRQDKLPQAGPVEQAYTSPTPERSPETASPGSTHDIRDVVSYIERHIDDDRKVGRTLRRVVRKGTPADVASFISALIKMLDAQPEQDQLRRRR